MDYKNIKNHVPGMKPALGVKNPKRYRLDFIKENTFNRLWSIRMTRTRVWISAIAVFAAVGALIYVIFAFTPMRRLLPVSMHQATRSGYLETSLKVDSLQNVVRQNTFYAENIVSILEGNGVTDSMFVSEVLIPSDSVSLAASQNEKTFVKNYEAEQRFNLSVLSPIAAEGMDFVSPIGTIQTFKTENIEFGTQIISGKSTPANAIYKGTIIGISNTPDGLSTVIIQHPNDFMSVYSGLKEVFVEKGMNVTRSQRIGHSGSNGLSFELWHNGAALTPSDYIPALTPPEI